MHSPNSGITRLPDPFRPRQEIQIRQIRRRPRQPFRRRLSTRPLTIQRFRALTKRRKSRRRRHVRSRDEPRRNVPTILRRRRHGRRWFWRSIRYVYNLSRCRSRSHKQNTTNPRQVAAASSAAAQGSSSTWAAAPAYASTNSAATDRADARTTTQTEHQQEAQTAAHRRPQPQPSNLYYLS